MSPLALPGDDSVAGWRAQVPGLARTVNGRPLVYMDYAATAQRPLAVLDAVRHAMIDLCANVDRGVHRVGAEASAARADARKVVADFVAAPTSELIFTGGTTDGLNLAASCIAEDLRLQSGDRILVSTLDHHANLIPWQLQAKRVGARLEAMPLTDELEIDVDAVEARLRTGDVRVVAFPVVSNVLGTRTPVEALVERARRVGATIVLDAAQAVAHGPLDVTALGADVVAFGAHKVFGPMGIGALWAKRPLLDRWAPWRGGGGIVTEVSFDEIAFREAPARFEAGTPNLPGIVGFAAALRWLDEIGWPSIRARERALTQRCGEMLDALPGLHRLGKAPGVPLFAFTMAAHPHDVGSLLDQEGIAVRSGRHCADPLHAHLGLVGSTRASLSFLNTADEIEALEGALRRVLEVFGV